MQVAGLTLTLRAPADVDPTAGADTLSVRVLDPSGDELASTSAALGAPLALPDLDSFGVIDVEVTATLGPTVLAGARSGPLFVGDGTEASVEAWFLPVNQAVRLGEIPLADRLEPLTVDTADGRVLVVGGRQPGSAFVWNTSEWWSVDGDGYGAQGPDLPVRAWDVSSTTLPDGSILVSGGHSGDATSRSATTFTLAADGSAVTQGPDMQEARAEHCLASFQGGSVIALGGASADDDPLAEEIGRAHV